jgi:hypothetical protein
MEVVMADGTVAEEQPRRALVEVSPELAQRLRDPRLALAVVAAACGAVALLVGYLGVSGTLDPGKQLPYLVSGGVGGLFLLGVAAALLFSADLGATREEIADLRDAVDSLTAKIDELQRTTHEAPPEAAPAPPRKRSPRTR